MNQVYMKSGATIYTPVTLYFFHSVSAKAQRPDDVVTMYSGRTVEVNNTDAEGRLVLGDGVAFAKKDLKVRRW